MCLRPRASARVPMLGWKPVIAKVLLHPGALLHVYAALSRPRHDAAHAEGAEGAVFLDEAQGPEVGVEQLQPRVFDAPRECSEVVEEALGATFALGDDAHEVVVDVVRASSSGDVAAANENLAKISGLILYLPASYPGSSRIACSGGALACGVLLMNSSTTFRLRPSAGLSELKQFHTLSLSVCSSYLRTFPEEEDC